MECDCLTVRGALPSAYEHDTSREKLLVGALWRARMILDKRGLAMLLGTLESKASTFSACATSSPSSIVGQAVVGMSLWRITQSYATINATVRMKPDEFALLVFLASQMDAAWCFASEPSMPLLIRKQQPGHMHLGCHRY